MKDWLEKEKKAWIDSSKERNKNTKETYAPIQDDYKEEFEDAMEVICKNAAAAPSNINIDDAEVSMDFVQNRYLNLWLDLYQQKLDPYAQFWITIDVYSMAPYRSISKKKIINLKKIRPSDYLRDLDPALTDKNPIIIYRGGNETRKEAINSFSWTTNLATAIWFYAKKLHTYEQFGSGEAPVIWTGQIYKKDIIATDNDREEFEIFQHGSIKNLEEMCLTDEEIKSALGSLDA